MWKNFAGIKFRGLAMLKVSRVLNFAVDTINPGKPRNLVPAKFSTFKVQLLLFLFELYLNSVKTVKIQGIKFSLHAICKSYGVNQAIYTEYIY